MCCSFLLLCGCIFTFTFSHFADAFIQSDLQLGNTKLFILKRQTDRGSVWDHIPAKSIAVKDKKITSVKTKFKNASKNILQKI